MEKVQVRLDIQLGEDEKVERCAVIRWRLSGFSSGAACCIGIGCKASVQ